MLALIHFIALMGFSILFRIAGFLRLSIPLLVRKWARSIPLLARF